MNSTKKLVSVVVPVYNAEKYLWDTIWNIRSQSYKDIEILLINDASKDKSEEICKELAKADERIRVISHPHNMGAGGARNTGIIAARGEYLIFADADDDCDKDMIKEAVDKIENDGTDWVIWGIKEKIYDTKGKQLSERDIVPKDGCFTDTDDARMQIIGLEKSTLFGYPYNKLYKIHIIKACGIRFNKDVLYEDFVFNADYAEKIKSLSLLPKASYTYEKRNEDNVTSRFVKEYFELSRKRVKRVYDMYVSWGLLNKNIRDVLANKYFRYYLSALARNCDARSKMDKEARKEWVEKSFKDDLVRRIAASDTEFSKLNKKVYELYKNKCTGRLLHMGTAVRLAQKIMPGKFAKEKSK